MTLSSEIERETYWIMLLDCCLDGLNTDLIQIWKPWCEELSLDADSSIYPVVSLFTGLPGTGVDTGSRWKAWPGGWVEGDRNVSSEKRPLNGRRCPVEEVLAPHGCCLSLPICHSRGDTAPQETTCCSPGQQRPLTLTPFSLPSSPPSLVPHPPLLLRSPLFSPHASRPWRCCPPHSVRVSPRHAYYHTASGQ